jgi:hypothetical protein
MGAVRNRPRLWLSLAVVVVVAGAAIAYLIISSPKQPEVNADVLPVVPTAREAAGYVDCSKINSVAYFADNPCQTFVLVTSDEFRSAMELLDAEVRHLGVVGWRHSDAQPVDDDGATGGMATVSQSWVAPDRRACAYVTTDAMGVAEEARELFPYDPYNQPPGVLTFYRHARSVRARPVLWVRLTASASGRCVG